MIKLYSDVGTPGESKLGMPRHAWKEESSSDLSAD